jgi:4-amino-4-deoxy-L-arabinose transferase-like glycosyltransferase
MKQLNTYPKRTIVIHIILLLIFVALTVLTVANSATAAPPSSDDDQYISMGYNMQKYKTFSMDTKDVPNPEPTAYREPGFPALIALDIALSPRLREMSREQLYAGGLKQLRYDQIPLIIIIALLAMFITIRVTKSIPFGYIMLFMVGSSEILAVTANHLFSENIAIIFLLCASLLLYKIYEEKKIIYFILLGISLALLTLVKAIFMYFILFVLIVFIIYIVKDRLKRKKIIAGALLFIVFYSLLIGGWMYRNYRQFGSFFVANGGGVILLLRAGKDTLTNKEILASFIYWMPGEKVKNEILDRTLGKESYARLDRSKQTSIYRIAQNTRDNLTEQKLKEGYTKGMADLIVDKELRKMGEEGILKNPFRHLLVTLPIAWRGIFIEVGFTLTILNNNFLLLQFDTILFINIFLFFCFFYVIILILKKRKWQLLMLYIPAIYLYLINSFITQDKPRYNIAFLPLLFLAAIMFVSHMINKTKKKGPGLEVNHTDPLL